MRLLNPGSEPAVVNKGTRIARLELVETPDIDVDNTTCVSAVEDECSTAADIPKRKQEFIWQAVDKSNSLDDLQHETLNLLLLCRCFRHRQDGLQTDETNPT